MLWTSGLVLALSALAAVVAFRRTRDAETYVPPTHLGSSALPASALTPPDRLERRRGLAVIWWTLMLASTALVVWGLWMVFSQTVTFDDPEIGYFVVGMFVALLVWLPAVVMFVWSRAALARNARLASQHPDALILTMYSGLSDSVVAGLTLRRVCGVQSSWWSARVPTLATLMVDDAGLRFWRGGSRPRLQYTVPWAAVGPISPAFVDVGTSGSISTNLGIEMEFRASEGGVTGWTELAFLATRSNMWVTVPYRSKPTIEAISAAIEGRRPSRAQLFHGLTFEEIRAALDEAEGDGGVSESFVSDLRAWYSALDERTRARAPWLQDRIDAMTSQS